LHRGRADRAAARTSRRMANRRRWPALFQRIENSDAGPEAAHPAVGSPAGRRGSGVRAYGRRTVRARAGGAMKPAAELCRKYREAGWWRDATFLDDLRRNATERPGKTAIVGRLVAKGQTDVIDYAELSRLTSGMVRGLAELGVRPGEFIGAQIHD